MNYLKQLTFGALLIISCAATVSAQDSPGAFSAPMFPGNSNDKETAPQNASDPAQPFMDQGRDLMINTKFSESKEALRTAIRISPMNPQLWALYDEAVAGEYVERKRKEKISPVIERDISPTFSIDRIDSYIELGTLYVVGSLKNVSAETRQKITLIARLFDENKKELRRETGVLRNTERGLYPNESSLFEIPFRNPPPGGKSFRVEVESYE